MKWRTKKRIVAWTPETRKKEEDRIDSEEENLNKGKNPRNQKISLLYNAGGNDSDYDGGHPKDVYSESKAVSTPVTRTPKIIK